jgi:enterobactin synthetase component D
MFREDAVFSGVQLPPELTSAAKHRQAQFRAGRYCAGLAISRLCGPGADTRVARGERGAPVWPASLTGSITHTREFAWAAVALRTVVTSVGIDTERVVAPDLGRRISTLVLTATDTADEGLDEATWITLVFSAKEALFKCVYPLVGRQIDYSAATIRREKPGSARFSAVLLEELSPGLPAGTALAGAFERSAERSNEYVHTAVWLPA